MPEKSEKYIPTIGLEIHAQLRTTTKMFCNSKNDPDESEPNVNVCPVCMGHPGTLPVINKKAVKHILKIGLAVGGELADFTEFDRKNYFYPDIPKGYQISQYKYPLVKGGSIKGVSLTRIHLEEDTARSFHKEDHSLIDFNRAGIPLMELVTEPDITSAKQAGDFARELQLLLRTLGVAEANMEKGEMRIEANVSVSQKSQAKSQKLGTKVEVKNINSFKAVESAIDYEINRQIQERANGGKVVQETRGWDDERGATFPQRVKETSEDYRYFPDPDLPKLKISEIEEFAEEKLRSKLPELPWEKRERLAEEYGLKEEDIEHYVQSKVFGDFFEEVMEHISQKLKPATAATASNYITSDLAGLMTGAEEISLDPKDFAELIEMVESNKVSSRGAKDILAIMVESGGSPRSIAEEKNLLQISDEEELMDMVQEIIKENPDVAGDYRGGKESALKYLIGQGMRKSKGSANPKVLAKLLKEKLN